MPDSPFNPPPEPMLKPNQPTQSIAAPAMVRLRLCAGIGAFSYPLRLPSIKHAANAATPALICTAVPPAKSSTPQLCIKAPAPPQTMCATGA
ncbi:hypothetical protein D3C86_1768440 [compost metagenome]